jgi:hypothetical protein
MYYSLRCARGCRGAPVTPGMGPELQRTSAQQARATGDSSDLDGEG